MPHALHFGERTGGAMALTGRREGGPSSLSWFANTRATFSKRAVGRELGPRRESRLSRAGELSQDYSTANESSSRRAASVSAPRNRNHGRRPRSPTPDWPPRCPFPRLAIGKRVACSSNRCTPFLRQIKQNTGRSLADLFQRQFQLRSAIAAPRRQDISGKALRVHPHQWRSLAVKIPAHQRHRFFLRTVPLKSINREAPVTSRQFRVRHVPHRSTAVLRRRSASSDCAHRRQ